MHSYSPDSHNSAANEEVHISELEELTKRKLKEIADSEEVAKCFKCKREGANSNIIESVGELLDRLCLLFQGNSPPENSTICSGNTFTLPNLWFRGEPSPFQKEHPLTPNILRLLDKTPSKANSEMDWAIKEGRLYNYVELMTYDRLWSDPRFPPEINSQPLFYKLIAFQHYYAQTRLLDWTMNPLIALHFASKAMEKTKGNHGKSGLAPRSKQEDERDGFLYVLNPISFNKHESFGRYRDCGFLPYPDSFSTLARLAFILRDPAVVHNAENSYRNLTHGHLESLLNGHREAQRRIFVDFCTWLLNLSNLLTNSKPSIPRLIEEIPSLKETAASRSFQAFAFFLKLEGESDWINLCRRGHSNSLDPRFSGTSRSELIPAFDSGFQLMRKVLEVFSRPIAILPPWMFERMRVQQSAFTLFGGFLFPIRNHPQNQQGLRIDVEKYSIRSMVNFILQENPKELPLYVFRIPGSSKSGLRKQLKQLGIHEAGLFGDEPSRFLTGLYENILENP